VRQKVQADPAARLKELHLPATGPIKKVLKDVSKDRVLEDIEDTEVVFWADVKKTFPGLEAQLKPLFGGRDRLPVGELKKAFEKDVTEEESKYWLSEVNYNPAWDIQRELPRSPEYHQVAVQINIGPDLVRAIDADPVAQKFFAEVSRKLHGDSLHPNSTQTIAWARVYMLPDKYVIEELQSDIFGASLKTADTPKVSKSFSILESMAPEDKAELDKFFHKHFLDWDKKLVASVIALARKNGIKDVYMWDDQVKTATTNSQSKLERHYKIVPRDLGFKRGQLDIAGKKMGVWHRVVASTSLDRLAGKFQK
jgi:hypothetical protein